MKKITIILFTILFVTGSIFAQKGNDRKGNKNSNNKGDKPKDNTNGGGSDNTCMNTALSITGSILGSYQKNLLSSTRKRPWISSVEIMAHGGMMGSYLNALPRVRLNYGAISADIRYDYLKETLAETNNIDALLDFNIIVGDFKMTLGQGVMYNVDTKLSFHESFIGMDVGVMRRQIIVSPEFRFVYDWTNKAIISSEVTLKGGFRVLKLSRLDIYVNAAAGYRDFLLFGGNVVVNGWLNFIIH